MNFTRFPANATNIFPIANSKTGGQLLTEFNLRSRESVLTNSDVKYFIGPSYCHSFDDFTVRIQQDELGTTISSTTLEITEGKALVNGHYIESLVPVTVDLAEANRELKSEGYSELKGRLAIGLRAMYSTEQTLSASLKIENNQGLIAGIQIVILPVGEVAEGYFVLPEDSPDTDELVTAHLKLAEFYYINGQIRSVEQNPNKITAIPASRVGSFEGLLADHYITKDGLIPYKIYTMAGKSSDTTNVSGKPTWCDSTDSLFVWQKLVTKTYDNPELDQAEFGIDLNSERVTLSIPHKTVDGGMFDTEGNEQYFNPRVMYLPQADFELNTPGTITSSYTQKIKQIKELYDNIYSLASGKQRAYLDSIDSDRTELPLVNPAWNIGDYVIVREDNSVSESASGLSTAPSTIYVVIPPYVSEVEIVNPENPGYNDNLEVTEIPAALTGSNIHTERIDFYSVQSSLDRTEYEGVLDDTIKTVADRERAQAAISKAINQDLSEYLGFGPYVEGEIISVVTSLSCNYAMLKNSPIVPKQLSIEVLEDVDYNYAQKVVSDAASSFNADLGESPSIEGFIESVFLQANEAYSSLRSAGEIHHDDGRTIPELSGTSSEYWERWNSIDGTESMTGGDSSDTNPPAGSIVFGSGWTDEHYSDIPQIRSKSVYQLINLSGDKNIAVDLSASSEDDGTPIIGHEAHEDTNQKWQLVKEADGWTIRSKVTGKYIVVKDAQFESGSKLVQFSDGQDNKIWYFDLLSSKEEIDEEERDVIVIRSKGNNNLVISYDASVSDKSLVIKEYDPEDKTQQWGLKLVEEAPVVNSPGYLGVVLLDGTIADIRIDEETETYSLNISESVADWAATMNGRYNSQVGYLGWIWGGGSLYDLETYPNITTIYYDSFQQGYLKKTASSPVFATIEYDTGTITFAESVNSPTVSARYQLLGKDVYNQALFVYYKQNNKVIVNHDSNYRGLPQSEKYDQQDYITLVVENVPWWVWEEQVIDGEVHTVYSFVPRNRYYYYKVTKNETPNYDYTIPPIILTGNIYLATEEQIGGFLNISESELDAGYVYRDSEGHLRLLDYSLLRSGVLAYQLGQDYSFGSGMSSQDIQDQLNEYVNERVAFPNDYQITASTNEGRDTNVIKLTLDLSKESSPNTLTIRNIDCRWGTSLEVIITGDPDSNTTINFENCEKLRLHININATDLDLEAGYGPVVNVYNCGLYYDPEVIDYIHRCKRVYTQLYATDVVYPSGFTGIENMHLWYEKFSDDDANLVLDGMTITAVETPVIADDKDFWNESVINDNHYYYALQSVTLDPAGNVIGCGIYIRNDVTSNIELGKTISLAQFSIPQGYDFSYPETSITRQVKITGDFVSAYPSSSPEGYIAVTTQFTALSHVYNSPTSITPGTISFLSESEFINDFIDLSDSSSSSGFSLGITIDGWEPGTFHVFKGWTIG